MRVSLRMLLFYKVRIIRNEIVAEKQVCKKAFVSLHGLTNRRIETIQANIQRTRNPPKDKRGIHLNRKNTLTARIKNVIYQHIKSLKGRSSHYSINKTGQIYLPSDLNVKKMHQMFKDKFPDAMVSYESYRTIFCNKFNI